MDGNENNHINLLDILEDEVSETEQTEETKDEETGEGDTTSKEESEDDETTEGNNENTDTDDSDDQGDDDSDDDEDETDDEGSFWDDVEKVTGEKLEGDFDDTTEGAIEYLKAFREKGVDDYVNNFAETYPEAYELAVYMSKGGDPKEFFSASKEEDVNDYSNVELKEEEEDTLKEVISEDLKQQGLSDKRIKLLIESLEESDELFEEAKASKDRLAERANLIQEKRKEERQAEMSRRQEDVNAMVGNIDEVVKDGKVGKFVIPMNERDDFRQYLMENITYNNGDFYITSLISEKNVSDVLAQEFFKYKKGDLSEYIDKSATTKSTKRLKRNLKREEKQTSNSSKTELDAFQKLLKRNK